MKLDRKNLALLIFILMFLSLLGLTVAEADGSELNPRVGTSHSVLTAVGMAPRAAALGWSVTAVDLGAVGLDYNPASGAELGSRSIYLGHLDWVLDSSLSQAYLALPLWDSGIVSLGATYFDQGTIDEVLEDGTFTGERLGARDLQLSLGLAKPLQGFFNYGFKMTVLQKTLGWERSTGMMASLGVMSKPAAGFRLGAALQDFGPRFTFRDKTDPSPTRYRLGASYLSRVSGSNTLQTSLDLIVPRDNYASFGIGLEWDYAHILTLRLGYHRTLMEDDTPDGDRFCSGFGVRVGAYRLDYAFATKDDFSNVHRLGLTFDFRPRDVSRELEAIGDGVLARAAAYDSLISAQRDSLPDRGSEDVVPLAQVTLLQGITFNLGSASISEGSQDILQQIFQRLVHTPSVDAIEIQGHTDNAGDDKFNRSLSLERAKAVRDYLVKLGYPARKTGVMGFGNTRPLVTNSTTEGRAANRRIEIHLVRNIPSYR